MTTIAQTEVYCYRPDLAHEMPGSTACRAGRMDVFRRIRTASEDASDPVDLAFAAAMRGKVGMLEYAMQFRFAKAVLYGAGMILGLGIIGEAFLALRTQFAAIVAGVVVLGFAAAVVIDRYGTYSLWIDVHGSRIVAFGHASMFIADRRNEDVVQVPLGEIRPGKPESTRDLRRAEISDPDGHALVLIERISPAANQNLHHAIEAVLERIEAARA